jgi:hypothetical protein
MSNSSLEFPFTRFGQLLIELHFVDVPTTVNYFDTLKRHNYYAFSREINLLPCIAGNMPIAVEYSIINPKIFFDVNARYANVPAPHTLHWHSPINVVIYYLTQKARVLMMKSALYAMYLNVYQQHPYYSVLIFHDDLDKHDMNILQSAVPRMKLNFIYYPLKLPYFLDINTIPNRTLCSPKSSTIGYRHMIRFHSTLIHEYLFSLDNPFYNVEYIMRLDDDSSFETPIGYDMFKFMRVNDKKYGFVSALLDGADCVTGLWNFTDDFIRKNRVKHNIPKGNLETYKKWKRDNVFYNNFEISHVSIWKSKLWLDFMDAIDKSGEIYYTRWGDAPIHTLIVLLLLPEHQIHRFSDISYIHKPFANQKATSLPHPESNIFFLEMCEFFDTWKCVPIFNSNNTNSSNVTIYGDNSNPLSPLWSQNSISSVVTVNTEKKKKNKYNYIMPSTNDNSNLNTVLYTFAHFGRIDELAGI